MTYSKEDWLSDVSISVPGAPRAIVEDAIMDTIRDFCESTLLWVRQLDAIDIVAGTVEYPLVAPAGVQANVVLVDRAEFSGSFMAPESMDLLDRLPDAWRAQTGSSSDAFIVDAEKTLRLRYIPTESITAALVVWAALKPSYTADNIPDFIYNDWFDCILNGAISNLFRKPRQIWTNIQEAEYFYQQYIAERSRAKGVKTTGKTKLSLRVQCAPFSVV